MMMHAMMKKIPLLLACTLTCFFDMAITSATGEPFFDFSSGVTEYDDAYKLAMTEMEQNIENGIFIAGAGWKQLWTRDTSYAVELGAGLVHPELSKKSLEKSTQMDKKLDGKVWLQDMCGHFQVR